MRDVDLQLRLRQARGEVAFERNRVANEPNRLRRAVLLLSRDGGDGNAVFFSLHEPFVARHRRTGTRHRFTRFRLFFVSRLRLAQVLAPRVRVGVVHHEPERRARPHHVLVPDHGVVPEPEHRVVRVHLEPERIRGPSGRVKASSADERAPAEHRLVERATFGKALARATRDLTKLRRRRQRIRRERRVIRVCDSTVVVDSRAFRSRVVLVVLVSRPVVLHLEALVGGDGGVVRRRARRERMRLELSGRVLARQRHRAAEPAREPAQHGVQPGRRMFRLRRVRARERARDAARLSLEHRRALAIAAQRARAVVRAPLAREQNAARRGGRPVDRPRVRAKRVAVVVVAERVFVVEGVDGRQDVLILILTSFVVTRASGARRVAVAGDRAGTVHRGRIVPV